MSARLPSAETSQPAAAESTAQPELRAQSSSEFIMSVFTEDQPQLNESQLQTLNHMAGNCLDGQDEATYQQRQASIIGSIFTGSTALQVYVGEQGITSDVDETPADILASDKWPEVMKIGTAFAQNLLKIYERKNTEGFNDFMPPGDGYCAQGYETISNYFGRMERSGADFQTKSDRAGKLFGNADLATFIVAQEGNDAMATLSRLPLPERLERLENHYLGWIDKQAADREAQEEADRQLAAQQAAQAKRERQQAAIDQRWNDLNATPGLIAFITKTEVGRALYSTIEAGLPSVSGRAKEVACMEAVSTHESFAQAMDFLSAAGAAAVSETTQLVEPEPQPVAQEVEVEAVAAAEPAPEANQPIAEPDETIEAAVAPKAPVPAARRVLGHGLHFTIGSTTGSRRRPEPTPEVEAPAEPVATTPEEPATEEPEAEAEPELTLDQHVLRYTRLFVLFEVMGQYTKTVERNYLEKTPKRRRSQKAAGVWLEKHLKFEQVRKTISQVDAYKKLLTDNQESDSFVDLLEQYLESEESAEKIRQKYMEYTKENGRHRQYAMLAAKDDNRTRLDYLKEFAPTFLRSGSGKEGKK